MVDTRRKPFGELTMMQKLFSVIIPTLAAIWSIFGGAYSFSQATLAYNTLSSTAADMFSMAANFESTPIVDATLSDIDCSTLASKTSLPWEGLKVEQRFTRSGSIISGSNEKDTSFTNAWEGTSAYCMCGTTDYPATGGAKKHACNATTYDVSKNDPLLGCIGSGSTASTTVNTGGANVRGSTGNATVNTKDGTIYSHPGLCNATSTEQGCVSIPAAKAIPLVKIPKYWLTTNSVGSVAPTDEVPGKYFCVRRAGKPSKEYTTVTKASECDSAKQVFCGTFCYSKKDNDGKCPAVEIVLINNADYLNVKHWNQSSTHWRGLNVTPIVNVVLGRGRPCYGYEGGDGLGYPKQDFSAIPNLEEADNGWTDVDQCGYKATGTTEESKATGIDKRYDFVANFNQWNLYSANGINSNGVRTKIGVAGTNAELTVYNPWKFIDKEKKAASGDASAWTLATRGGIYWKPKCSMDANKRPDMVTKNTDPVTQLVSLHYWLMFTQGFFGLFIVGIVLGTTTLYSMHSPNQDCPCVAGKGAVEMQRIGKFKTICGTTANLIKVPVLVFAVSVTGMAGAIFNNFKECAGDDISNHSFKSMSDMIMAAGAADRRALYIDLATLLYTLVTSFRAWRKGCKPNYAIMRDPPEGWDDDDRKDVELE